MSQRKAGVIVGYLNILVKNCVNLIYTPLLLHFLGQADYGVFQMTNSTVVTLTLLSVGFTESYLRFYSQRKIHGNDDDIRRLNALYFTMYLSIAVLSLILGGILVANVDSLFAQGLTANQVALSRSLMIIMVGNIAVSFLSTPFDAFIMANEQFVFQQSRQLFTQLAIPVIAIVSLYCGMGAVGVATAQFTVSCILLFLNVRFAYGKLHMRFLFRNHEHGLFKAILMFSFWILLNQIFEMVNQQVPSFLLGALSGATTVAVFSIALQIRTLFISLSVTISNVFSPLINRMVAEKDDNTALTELMIKVGHYQLMLFCFIFGGFVIVGHFFIDVWAGKANSDAYYLAVLMSLPVVVPLIQNTGIEIQRAKNRHRMRSLIYVLTAVLNIIISVLLIPTLGYWATVLGYVTSLILGPGLFMNWYYQYRIGLDMVSFWKRQIPTLLLSACIIMLCLFGTWVVPVDGFISFFGWGISYVGISIVAFWTLILSPEEKTTIIGRLHRA